MTVEQVKPFSLAACISAFRRITLPVWFGFAGIVLLTLIAYWPAIHGGFIWDDDSYVTQNTLLHDLDGLRRIWIPRQTPQYYPAVFTSFWIEYQLWGLNPLGYHLVNVLLHIGNALLVWRLAVVLRIPGGVAAGWLIGIIFALHPVHVESVAWITERKNVLSGLFYLSAALCYLQFDALRQRQSERETTNGELNMWPWYAAAIVLFLLALFSKTVTCSLPAALILMMLWLRRPITLARIVPLLPLFILGLALALNTASLEREHVGAVGDDFAFSFAERVIIASKALLFYPQKLLWPWPVMFIYPRWNIDANTWISFLPTLLVLAVAAACLVAYLRNWRGPGLALAFYAGTIFPALGFFNVYPMLFSFVADHFQYLASLGVIVLAVGGSAYLIGSTRFVLIVGIAVIPPLMLITWTQSAVYENAETVWLDTLAKNDAAWMPHNNMASSLLRRAGDALAAGDDESALALATRAEYHAQKSLHYRPGHQQALVNLSEALRVQGRLDEAFEAAKQALEGIKRRQLKLIERRGLRATRLPHVADAYWRVGRLHELMGDAEQAAAAYLSALEFDATNADVHADAFRTLRSASESARQDARFADAQRWLEALNQQARTIQQRVDAGYRLAEFLATCPDPAYRNSEQAVHLAELAHRLASEVNMASPYTFRLLAVAYAADGRKDDAIRAAEQGAAMARELQMIELANELADMASRYHNMQ